jgi:hypothetical protein
MFVRSENEGEIMEIFFKELTETTKYQDIFNILSSAVCHGNRVLEIALMVRPE